MYSGGVCGLSDCGEGVEVTRNILKDSPWSVNELGSFLGMDSGSSSVSESSSGTFVLTKVRNDTRMFQSQAPVL